MPNTLRFLVLAFFTWEMFATTVNSLVYCLHRHERIQNLFHAIGAFGLFLLAAGNLLILLLPSTAHVVTLILDLSAAPIVIGGLGSIFMIVTSDHNGGFSYE